MNLTEKGKSNKFKNGKKEFGKSFRSNKHEKGKRKRIKECIYKNKKNTSKSLKKGDLNFMAIFLERTTKQ